jgi:hypothetical protein
LWRANSLKDMVGPWELEPQTSTVSKTHFDHGKTVRGGLPRISLVGHGVY